MITLKGRGTKANHHALKTARVNWRGKCITKKASLLGGKTKGGSYLEGVRALASKGNGRPVLHGETNRRGGGTQMGRTFAENNQGMAL